MFVGSCGLIGLVSFLVANEDPFQTAGSKLGIAPFLFVVDYCATSKWLQVVEKGGPVGPHFKGGPHPYQGVGGLVLEVHGGADRIPPPDG